MARDKGVYQMEKLRILHEVDDFASRLHQAAAAPHLRFPKIRHESLHRSLPPRDAFPVKALFCAHPGHGIRGTGNMVRRVNNPRCRIARIDTARGSDTVVGP